MPIYAEIDIESAGEDEEVRNTSDTPDVEAPGGTYAAVKDREVGTNDTSSYLNEEEEDVEAYMNLAREILEYTGEDFRLSAMADELNG